MRLRWLLGHALVAKKLRLLRAPEGSKRKRQFVGQLLRSRVTGQVPEQLSRRIHLYEYGVYQALIRNYFGPLLDASTVRRMASITKFGLLSWT